MTSADLVATDRASAPAAAERKLSRLDQWCCVASYPLTLALSGIAFFSAGLLPPIPPGDSPENVANRIAENSTSIGIAIVLLLVAVGGQMPFMGLVVTYMRQMSGPGHLLGYIYIGSYGAATFPGAVVCTLAWGAAILRPDRDPELIVVLNDIAYLGFITVIGGFMLPYLCLGLAIAFDRNGVLPLWVAYVCAWEVVAEMLFVPIHLFKAGPFAWTGVLAFWIGVSMFAVWLGIMTFVMASATRRGVLEPERRETRAKAALHA